MWIILKRMYSYTTHREYDDSDVLSQMTRTSKIRPILIAPVSGQAFPHQLEILLLLAQYVNYRPYLSLCTSGGNVATYLAYAGRFNPSGIRRIARDLNSSQFVESWMPGMLNWLPSLTAGFFMGATYKSSDGAEKIFHTYFTSGSIQDSLEVWVGTTNKDTGAASFFCNKSEEDSIIKSSCYNCMLTSSEPLHYLAGDLDKIGKASAASASIPTLVEGQNINGKNYVDGGVKLASPLAAMQECLMSHYNDTGRLQLVYVNGYNVEQQLSLKSGVTSAATIRDIQLESRNDDDMYQHQNIIESGLSATRHMTLGMILSDRLVAYTMIRSLCKEGQTLYYMVVPRELIMYVWQRLEIENISVFLYEIYSNSKDYIDYTNFNGQDVLSVMDSVKHNHAGRLWYVSTSALKL